jgi:hypothetical protein
MKKVDSDEMRAQYDFAGGVRGKYLPRLAKGTNVVVLDRDVAKIFPTSKAATQRLRAVGAAHRIFPDSGQQRNCLIRA